MTFSPGSNNMPLKASLSSLSIFTKQKSAYH
jgi:hypothetical protein